VTVFTGTRRIYRLMLCMFLLAYSPPRNLSGALALTCTGNDITIIIVMLPEEKLYCHHNNSFWKPNFCCCFSNLHCPIAWYVCACAAYGCHSSGLRPVDQWSLYDMTFSSWQFLSTYCIALHFIALCFVVLLCFTLIHCASLWFIAIWQLL